MASSYQSRVELYKWKKKDVLCITEGNDVIVVCAHGIDSLNTNKILLQMENYFTLHGIKQVRLEMLKGKADLFIHKKIEPPDSTPLKNRE